MLPDRSRDFKIDYGLPTRPRLGRYSVSFPERTNPLCTRLQNSVHTIGSCGLK